MQRILIIFFAILSLLSSVHGQAKAAQRPEKPILYADMAKGDDGRYYITRITTEESRIDFMTLKPVGFDQKKWDCSSMFFGSFAFSDHRDCVPPDSEFRTSAKRPLPTFLLGATTLGASMIFGIVIEESVFDEAAFSKAVGEAIKNSGLEAKREDLLKRYMALTDVVEERDEELAELFRKYRDEYYNSTAPARVDKQIEDASGLYAGDLYPDLLMRVNRNALSDLKPATASSVSISGTPEEFEARLAAIEGALHSQRLDLEAALKNATKDYPVICGPEQFEPYHLKYDCPSRITGGQGTTPVAKAIVVSKDIKGALPDIFEAEDSALKVTFRKGKLFMENRTGERLNITGASLSYRGSSANSSKAAELAPSSAMDATSLYSLITPAIEKAARFDNMTLREAEKTPVDVSLTVDYELGSEKKTLKGEKVFRLSELIKTDNPVKSRPAALN